MQVLCPFKKWYQCTATSKVGINKHKMRFPEDILSLTFNLLQLIGWCLSVPPEYMNQEWEGSEVANDHYEDLSLGSALSTMAQQSGAPSGGPEYLNTVAGDSLDNPHYQAMPPPTAAPAGLFLPAAENLEYLGLGAAMHAPVR